MNPKEFNTKRNNIESFKDLDIKTINNIKSQKTTTKQVICILKTIYDPELSVNIFDLGLIYSIDIEQDKKQVNIDMTLTSAVCPMADFILQEIKTQVVKYIKEIKSVKIKLVWEPKWQRSMISEEGKFIMGLD